MIQETQWKICEQKKRKVHKSWKFCSLCSLCYHCCISNGKCYKTLSVKICEECCTNKYQYVCLHHIRF